MKPKDLEKELAEAYKSLDKADRQIKSLLIERKQKQMLRVKGCSG